MIECILEDWQLATLKALSKRLYTENRMDGDTMRNYAQALDAMIRDIEACIPKETGK